MMISLVVLLFGLIVGSFLNVCIARLPEGISIVTPRSRCPRCKAQIAWFDNIPLISYLLLRAKCRHCGLPISIRYPLVELLNGLLYLWSVHEFGLGGETLLAMTLCSSCIVITFVDLDHMIIPDVITLPGMVIGLAVAPFFMTALMDPLPFGFSTVLPDGPYLRGFWNALLGLVAGGAPLFLIGWAWEKLRKIEAMGGGDVKLMGMIGSFLGWKSALLTIMLGAMSGAIVGGTMVALKRHKPENVIPFGPFLAGGALLSLFYGNDILVWYLDMLRI